MPLWELCRLFEQDWCGQQISCKKGRPERFERRWMAEEKPLKRTYNNIFITLGKIRYYEARLLGGSALSFGGVTKCGVLT